MIVVVWYWTRLRYQLLTWFLAISIVSSVHWTTLHLFPPEARRLLVIRAHCDQPDTINT